MSGNRIAADSVYLVAASLLPYGELHKRVLTSRMYLKLYKEQNIPAAEAILSSLRIQYPAPYAIHSAETLYRLYRGGVKTLPAAPAKETDTLQSNSVLPSEEVALYQNYPNPFNPSTSISYSIHRPMHVLLDVYNIYGQKVATLVDGVKDRGRHTVEFHTGNLPSGTYIYLLRTEGAILRKTMNILK